MTTLKQCLDTSIDFSEGFTEKLTVFAEKFDKNLEDLPYIVSKHYIFEDFDQFTIVQPMNEYAKHGVVSVTDGYHGIADILVDLDTDEIIGYKI